MSDESDFDLLRSSLKIECCDRGYTEVVAIVVDQGTPDSPTANKRRYISCSSSAPLSQGYAYNQERDAYICFCVDFLPLGKIRAAYDLSIADANWSCRLPLPSAVIERYLGSSEKANLSHLRQRYKEDRYKIKLVQMKS